MGAISCAYDVMRNPSYNIEKPFPHFEAYLWLIEHAVALLGTGDSDNAMRMPAPALGDVPVMSPPSIPPRSSSADMVGNIKD
jgi:hypothetical protein